MSEEKAPVIKVIPAKKRALPQTIGIDDQPKTRVAAYCRVSTAQEEQESSYEAQVLHYTEYILCHRGWVLAGIFADEGISGTDTRKRDAFNRMIAQCQEGRIDLVITKSISRFARNTLDCLNYIRMLKERGIPVFFEKENINTMDARGEVIIAIMASLAQQESQSISQNVRLGIQYQFQQGKVRINHSWLLGYTKDGNGRLVIIPEEAEVVRRIYADFLAGKSPRKIARGLEADSIPTGAGRQKWYDSTIRSMLTNEKYMGDALLQKYYTESFLTKKKMKNEGMFPQYYVENSHPPIIPRETFLLVQDELHRRGKSRLYDETGAPGHKYALSGTMVCSCCGSGYRRMQASGNNRFTVWRCKKRLQKGAPCPGRSVREPDVQAAILSALNALALKKGIYLEKQEELSRSLDKCREEIISISLEIRNLEYKILQHSGSMRDRDDPQYSLQAVQNALSLPRLKDDKQTLIEQSARLSREGDEIRNILKFIESREDDGVFVPETEYNEAQMTILLSKVTVLPDGFEIRFKGEI